MTKIDDTFRFETRETLRRSAECRARLLQEVKMLYEQAFDQNYEEERRIEFAAEAYRLARNIGNIHYRESLEFNFPFLVRAEHENVLNTVPMLIKTVDIELP